MIEGLSLHTFMDQHGIKNMYAVLGVLRQEKCSYHQQAQCK